MALFGAQNRLGVTLTLQVKALLMKFNLTNKIITYVKDERGNLSTLVATLTIVVDCVPLQIDTLTLEHVSNMLCPRHVSIPLIMTMFVLGRKRSI